MAEAVAMLATESCRTHVAALAAGRAVKLGAIEPEVAFGGGGGGVLDTHAPSTMATTNNECVLTPPRQVSCRRLGIIEFAASGG